MAVCGFLNTDQCAIDACIIESYYVNRVAEFIIDEATGQAARNFEDKVTQAYYHDSGFDVKGNCRPKPGVVGEEKQCCGAFPKRFPFKLTTRICCPDGSLGFVGALCD